MLRKNIRLRKEYLYENSKLKAENEEKDKILELKAAIDNSKDITNKLNDEKLKTKLSLSDARTLKSIIIRKGKLG